MGKISVMGEKPSRSDDDVLSAEEQQKINQLVREHFSSLAPKRPLKPTRSEPLDGSHLLQEHLHEYDSHILETTTLKDLKANVLQAACEVEAAVFGDEYHENDYYKDLNAVDKIQHHTTGSGFIKVQKAGGDIISFHLEDDSTSGQVVPHSCKCNPATNDWIPSPETVFPPSQKPPRSDP